jgi:hypothetical protein
MSKKPELHVVEDEFGNPDGVEPTIPKFTRIEFERRHVKVAKLELLNRDDEFVRLRMHLETDLELDALAGVPLPLQLIRDLDAATRRSAGSKATKVTLKRDYAEAFYFFEHKGQAVAQITATPSAPATLTAKGNGVVAFKWKADAEVSKDAKSTPNLFKLIATHHLQLTATTRQRELFDEDVQGAENG